MPPSPKASRVAVDFSDLRSEPWLVKTLERLNRPRYQLDPSIQKELLGITRRAREAYTATGAPRLPVVRSREDMVVLMEENAQCLADRDRVTEILVSYVTVRYALDALWEYAEAQLLENAAFKMQTNAESRRAFIVNLLEPLHVKRNEVKKIIGMCETMQEHLSHTHYAIKQHVEMGSTYLNFRSA